jgi:hypothetical protein
MYMYVKSLTPVQIVTVPWPILLEGLHNHD